MGDDLLAVTEILEASQRADSISEENAEDVLSWLLENLSYILQHLVSCMLITNRITWSMYIYANNSEDYEIELSL